MFLFKMREEIHALLDEPPLAEFSLLCCCHPDQQRWNNNRRIPTWQSNKHHQKQKRTRHTFCHKAIEKLCFCCCLLKWFSILVLFSRTTIGKESLCFHLNIEKKEKEKHLWQFNVTTERNTFTTEKTNTKQEFHHRIELEESGNGASKTEEMQRDLRCF